MDEPLQSELFASIATLDQLKKMYDMGAVDVRSYERSNKCGELVSMWGVS
jgi:hypothetical protein